MSYTEYSDMFQKCQSTAPYHLFTYDMVNSKENCSSKRNSDLILLLFHVYQAISTLEEKSSIPILHRSKGLTSSKLEAHKQGNETFYMLSPLANITRKDLLEPFLINGDTIGFTILRNSLTESQVDTIFEQQKKKLNMPYEFHKANGYYETDDWSQGNCKYFRGYCICELCYAHKNKNEIER